jgi:hypothetical protein
MPANMGCYLASETHGDLLAFFSIMNPLSRLLYFWEANDHIVLLLCQMKLCLLLFFFQYLGNFFCTSRNFMETYILAIVSSSKALTHSS